MRKYTHWLKIDRYVKNDAEQWKEIQKYLDNYPEARATIFTYDSGNFNRVVKLVCYQEYNELDMDVNSLSTNLQRLGSKPQGITERGEFAIPESVKKRIAESR